MAALSGAVHWHKTTDHMTIRPIVRYPDPRLALPAQPVTVFDGALRDLARDLLETMHAAPGIGITAPHIGISLRLADLCQSRDHLGLTRDDHASGRQRLDARSQ